MIITISKIMYRVPMGSYHSRQIADLILLICEFNFFKTSNHCNNIDLCYRYIDDGIFISKDHFTSDIIFCSLSEYYPDNIPITFTSNKFSCNYLDITISLNEPLYYTT
jgi:hypothetical protein